MLTRPFHSPLRFDTSSSCIAQHTPTATRRLTAQALEILLVNQDHQQYSPPPSTHPISSRRRPFNSEPATASSISQPTTMHQDTFEARPLPPPQHTSRHNIHHQSSKWRAAWPTGLRRLPCRPPAPQPNHPLPLKGSVARPMCPVHAAHVNGLTLHAMWPGRASVASIWASQNSAKTFR